MDKKRGDMSASEKRNATFRKYREKQKALGYPNQQKYRETHKGEFYEPKLRLPASSRATLDTLLKQTGMTTTQFFSDAVYEKYGIDLTKK